MKAQAIPEIRQGYFKSGPPWVWDLWTSVSSPHLDLLHQKHWGDGGTWESTDLGILIPASLSEFSGKGLRWRN